jgi:DNA-binding CsgD family transcriptional regulator
VLRTEKNVGSGDLLERAEQLATLEHHLAAVTKSTAGRCVFVGGEAGVGKTSLVTMFCGRHSIRVLSGACDALATPQPLGPLLDVATATKGELHAAIARGGRPYEIASALLDELRSRGTSIVVLEDLHWADDATLDVLRLLARRVTTAPVLVIASYRDDQLDRTHPLRMLVGELVTSPAIFRLPISPLSAVAVAELAAPYGLDADALYLSTGGNPFFVSEVLAAGGAAMPQTVQDAVLARVARLGPRARRLVEAVAIIPAGVSLRLLEALDPESVESVEECLGSGVLAPTPDGVAFRHELARLAVEITLPPTRRTALHRRALTALAKPEFGPPDPTRLSHHAEAASDAAAVLRFAPEAAALAARVDSHREAAAQYARALRFGDGLSEERRAELMSLRSSECYLTGDYVEAIATRQVALESYRRLGDRLREGNALRAMSANLRCNGQVDKAFDAGLAAIEVLEPLAPSHELALAYANRAMLALNLEDTATTRAWGEKARKLAEHLDDRETMVHAMNSVGTAAYLLGHDDGRLALERSLELCKQWDFHEQAGRAYIHLAWVSVRLHDYARAEVYQREGIEYCLERGLDAWRFEILAHQARRLLDQGHWAEATEATSTILRSVQTNAVARTIALAVVALLRGRRGDPDPHAPLNEALTIAAPTGELQHLLPVATAEAEIDWIEGNLGTAAAASKEALEVARRYGAHPAIAELTVWRRRCGLPEPEPVGATGPYALELAGDASAAATAWFNLGCEYEAAVSLCASHTEADLRRALEIFQALETRPAAAIAARLLRQRGARRVPRGPRPSTKHNGGMLTTREVEVLGLIAQSMRNREIAQRLHLSEKTVDHHVAAILAKLDVSGRMQAVSAADRLGISHAT